jgi:hypothetical protein
MFIIDDLKTQDKNVTAKYANHAKKETDRGSPSRIWRISRLNLFAPRRRPLSDLCVPVVSNRATTPRCPVSFRQQSQFLPAATILSSSASMAGVPESEMRKTKPISSGQQLGGQSYKQSQFGAPAGTRADYAKQTKIWAQWQGRPSSRREALAMPPRRGAIAPNKTRTTKVGIGRADPRYWPRKAARIGVCGLLSCASNKANLAVRRGGQRPNVRHRLDAPLRETKPNMGALVYLGDLTRDARPDAPNKPNSRPGLVGRGPMDVVRTNPNPAAMPMRRSAFPGGQMRQTNQISRDSPRRHRDRRGGLRLLERHDHDFILRGLRVSVVQIRAKQSQTWAHWGIWVVCRCLGRSRLCQTNPIPGRAGWDEGRWMLYKQTQSLPLCRCGDRRS